MPGERRLIIGPNGAGKTTLFNLITGDLRRDSGAIQLFGEEVSRLKSHQRAHRGLARTYQIITLFPTDNARAQPGAVAARLSRSRWNGFKPLARYPELNEEARDVLRRVGLAHLAERSIGVVSYGENAASKSPWHFAQKPRVLLLDERSRGCRARSALR